MSKFIFPTSQKQATETAGQILTYGFGQEALGMALRTISPYYDLLDQIELVDGEATAQVKKTLDDTRLAIESLYREIQSRDANEIPSGSDQIRINGYIYLSGYTCRSVDQVVGKGWASEYMDTVAYSWNKTFGTVIDRAADTLDAASKIPQLSLDSAGKILGSLGSVGYVAMALLLVVGVGLAWSIAKGRVPK
jgi:hypothetical protein